MFKMISVLFRFAIKASNDFGMHINNYNNPMIFVFIKGNQQHIIVEDVYSNPVSMRSIFRSFSDIIYVEEAVEIPNLKVRNEKESKY